MRTRQCRNFTAICKQSTYNKNNINSNNEEKNQFIDLCRTKLFQVSYSSSQHDLITSFLLFNTFKKCYIDYLILSITYTSDLMPHVQWLYCQKT